MMLRFRSGWYATLAVLSLAGRAVGCGDGTGPSGPPVVISLNGATLPSGPVGSTVIIEGQNFGASQGGGTVVFAASGGTVAATIAGPDDWTDGFIVTTVPTGAVTGDLVVQTSGGTSDPVAFTVTQGAAFSPSAVSWTATTDLPAAVSGLAAAFVFVLGGVTDAAGTPTAAIQRGTLQADGTIASWTSAGTLPAPLHSFGAAIAFGNLYVWGGAGTGNATATAAYRADIQATGGLGAWQPVAALPFGRAYFGYGAFAGHLYALGGDSAATAPEDGAIAGGGRVSTVTYAQIELMSGDLTAAGWVNNPSSLIKATSKHTALVAGGSVLVTAGLYNGAATGATEESYAQLNADGTVSSFNGATGSNTILSGGGGNLFNHAVVGYVDATGAFHVLVLGGDDVNTPGTKHAEVFFY